MTIKTLFVIGAGASAEANLPVGETLKGQIAQLLDIRFNHFDQQSGDRLIPAALKQIATDINPHLHACWTIRDGMPLSISIDNFLDAHKGNGLIEQCGKIAIARSILDAESKSLMYANYRELKKGFDLSKLKDTWYVKLWQLLSEGCTIEDIRTRLQQVGFVVFNYDRCLEQFLFNAIKHYYNVHDQIAAEVLSSCWIYHPYGQVGDLPNIAKNTGIVFGCEPNPTELLKISGFIKTFTEGTDQISSDITQLRNIVANADKLVCLGFAYHPQNVEILLPKNSPLDRPISILGSAYKVSDANNEAIRGDFSSRTSGYANIHLEKCNANQFLADCSRALSFV